MIAFLVKTSKVLTGLMFAKILILGVAPTVDVHHGPAKIVGVAVLLAGVVGLVGLAVLPTLPEKVKND